MTITTFDIFIDETSKNHIDALVESIRALQKSAGNALQFYKSHNVRAGDALAPDVRQHCLSITSGIELLKDLGVLHSKINFTDPTVPAGNYYRISIHNYGFCQYNFTRPSHFYGWVKRLWPTVTFNFRNISHQPIPRPVVFQVMQTESRLYEQSKEAEATTDASYSRESVQLGYPVAARWF